MLSIRRGLTVLLPVALAAATVPAVADAAAPKNGYYIAPQLGVYVIVGGDGAYTTLMQASCMITPDNGGRATQQGGFAIRRRLTIGRSGRFAYDGKVTLNAGYSPTKVDLRIAGQFVRGKATGTVEFDGRRAFCIKSSFSARYYGLHPEG